LKAWPFMNAQAADFVAARAVARLTLDWTFVVE
jgi:hypothetical protein